MLTKRRLGVIATAALLAGLILIPAANASAAQVTEYTIATVTEGGGVAPVYFKDWAANTKLLYANGSQVTKGAWIASGTQLRFQVDPAAQNGIWIDTSKAFLKFYPSADDHTRCLSAVSGSYCLYAPTTHTLQIVTTTTQVLEWKVGVLSPYSGTTMRDVHDWSANTTLLYPNGQQVERGVANHEADHIRVIVTDPMAQNGIWLQWEHSKGIIMKFWPSDDRKTGCIPAAWCSPYNQAQHLLQRYVYEGNN